MLRRLGVEARMRRTIGELVAALIKALATRAQPRSIASSSTGAAAAIPGLTAIRASRIPRPRPAAGRSRTSVQSHPYWSGPAPCSMHIEEVEAIWSAIAERDDWQPFDDKVTAVRRMGEAMEQDAPASLTRRQRPRSPHAVTGYPRLDESGDGRGGLVGRDRRCRGRGRRGARGVAGVGRAFGCLSHRGRAPLRQCRSPKEAEFAELIARETGKPFWEARTEVGAVVNKVEISIDAYAERTPQRKMEAALGNKIAVRHKPHGVLAVLGPYNFPAHLPNGHIVPALIAGNAVVFKPSEKTPAVGEFLVRCFTKRRSRKAWYACSSAGRTQGTRARRRARHRRSAVHRLGPRRAVASPPVRRNAAEDPCARARRQQSARRLARQGHRGGSGDRRAVRLSHRRPALHRRAATDRGGRSEQDELIDAVQKLIDRMIVDQPFADPQPFMGPVIDNAAADHVQEQWLNLMMKGGKPLRRLDRPIADLPFLTPGTDRRDRRPGPARRRDFRARVAGDPGAGLRRGDRRKRTTRASVSPRA